MEKRSVIFSLGRNVFFAGLVSLFMDISSEMVYPLVPLFLTNVLGATLTAVGVIEGIAEATASLLKVFSGWLSDRLGKRKFLMGIGYGVSALSRPVIAGADSWFMVLVARFVDRVGKGVRTSPRDAIIAESADYSSLGAAFGFHRAMDTVGAVIGPLVAFAILYRYVDNLRLVFLASTVPAVIAVIVIVFFIKERAGGVGGVDKKAGPPRLSLSSFDGPFRRYMLVVGVFSLGNFADAFLILQAQHLGVEKGLITIIYLVFNIVYAASSIPIGIAADRIGIRKTLIASFIYYSAIFLAFAFSTEAVHAWILFPLYGIYKGMSDGTQRAYLATLAPKESKATAFGVYHTVVGLTLLPASVIAGYLWDTTGPGATFLYGSALSLLAAVIFVTGKGKPVAVE